MRGKTERSPHKSSGHGCPRRHGLFCFGRSLDRLDHPDGRLDFRGIPGPKLTLFGTERTMTAGDVTGVYALFSARTSGKFLQIFLIFLLNYTESPEKEEKSTRETSKTPVETLRNCGLLSLVVFKCVLILRLQWCQANLGMHGRLRRATLTISRPRKARQQGSTPFFMV